MKYFTLVLAVVFALVAMSSKTEFDTRAFFAMAILCGISSAMFFVLGIIEKQEKENL
jgi:hypothetical protein